MTCAPCREIHSSCSISLWESIKSCFSSLFCIFRTIIPISRAEPISNRTYALGGVENYGNTCIFSSLFQDFAALPEVYDAFLYSPIQKEENEEDKHFEIRQQFQQTLVHSIEKIRSGTTVKKEEVKKLASLLQELGWEGTVVSSLWRQWLHRLAPSIFSSIHYSPHKLYETALEQIVGEYSDAIPVHHFVLAQKDNESLPFPQYFQQRVEIEKKDRFLWRIVPKTGSESQLEEQFQIGQHLFSLKIIHVFQKTFSSNHTLVYRKLNEEWICCNDTKITPVKKLPTKNIYAVVYASQPL